MCLKDSKHLYRIKWCLSVSFRDNSKGLLNARFTFDEIYLQSIKDFLIIYAYLMFCKLSTSEK